MAEFCLDCFNKINDTNYKESQVVIDYDEPEYCEGCGEVKPVVISVIKPFF